MAEEFKNEELEAIQPIEEPTTEESAVVEEAPIQEEAPKPKKKASKKSASKKAPAKKAPGMYFEGKLIEAVPARLGRKWTVIIDGVRYKVPKEQIEIVE